MSVSNESSKYTPVEGNALFYRRETEDAGAACAPDPGRVMKRNLGRSEDEPSSEVVREHLRSPKCPSPGPYASIPTETKLEHRRKTLNLWISRPRSRRSRLSLEEEESLQRSDRLWHGSTPQRTLCRGRPTGLLSRLYVVMGAKTNLRSTSRSRIWRDFPGMK